MKIVKKRTIIFIDGSNFYHSLKRGGIKEIDFERLINELSKRKDLIKVYYYIAALDIKYNKEKYWEHQRFLENLRKIPKFEVVLCTLKKIKQKDGSYQFFIKGDDARLIHDLIVGAYENLYDEAIIVSGDEDFEPMIKTAQRLNKKIINAYFRASSSNALKRSCDDSINMNQLIKKIKNCPALSEDHAGEVINNINGL